MPALIHFDNDGNAVGSARETKGITCPVTGTFAALTVDGKRNQPQKVNDAAQNVNYTVTFAKNGTPITPVAVTDNSFDYSDKHVRSALDGSAVTAGDVITVAITGAGLRNPLFGLYIA